MCPIRLQVSGLPEPLEPAPSAQASHQSSAELRPAALTRSV
ncbi:hypothetical protein ACFVQ0_05325 [Streptomyces sp. NPDC057900]